MSYYTPSVIIDPHHVRPVGSRPTVQPAVNPRYVVHTLTLRFWSLIVDSSLMAVSSPVVVQQQIPQYLPTTTTAPVPIPATARSSVQSTPYLQQPFHTAQSLPMYVQQPQQAGYSMSSYTPGYTYGTPATTQYVPSSVRGSYVFVQDRSPSPRRHHHHSFGHRHNYGHRHHRGHHCFFHRRHRTYSDPEYDYRYGRY